MVYKKYIRKNGKVYGPYIYHSKRVDGKVVSEYRGPEEEKKRKKFWTFLVASILIISLGAFVLLSNTKSTGNAIISVTGNVNNGTLENGKLDFELTQGELIPANSIVSIENNGVTKQYSLKDLVKNEKVTSGNFSLQNKEISGSGEGYGLEGLITTYPPISFELNLKSSNPSPPNPINNSKNKNETKQTNTNSNNLTKTQNSSTNSTNKTNLPKDLTSENLTTNSTNLETNVSKNTTINNNSTKTQNVTNESQNNTNVQEKNTSNNNKNTTNETPLENTPNTTNQETNTSIENSTITGNIISNVLATTSKFFAGILTGNVVKTNSNLSATVSKNNPFIYQGNAKLISGSVNLNGQKLPDNTIALTKKGDKIVVTTNYSVTSEGFGPNYFGSKTKTLSIDLSKLNQTLSEGKLNINIFYNGSKILSFSQEIKNTTITNATKQPNLTNITSSVSLEAINIPLNLTQEEKNILSLDFKNANVTTTVKKYKERYLVDFSLPGYFIEHSYPYSLSESELKQNINRDKYLWVRDVLNSLSQKNSPEELLTNLSTNSSVF